ncbi:MAG: hypothetical protein PWP47_1548, partial [Synergistaceae bacterium]|nr:hypothetical protein [Synergistaceae bacterium]
QLHLKPTSVSVSLPRALCPATLPLPEKPADLGYSPKSEDRKERHRCPAGESAERRREENKKRSPLKGALEY